MVADAISPSNTLDQLGLDLGIGPTVSQGRLSSWSSTIPLDGARPPLLGYLLVSLMSII